MAISDFYLARLERHSVACGIGSALQELLMCFSNASAFAPVLGAPIASVGTHSFGTWLDFICGCLFVFCLTLDTYQSLLCVVIRHGMGSLSRKCHPRTSNTPWISS